MTDKAKAAANRKARDERKEAHLRAIFERYVERFRGASHQDAPTGARETHHVIELVLERDRKRDANSAHIKCRKGCVHCCHEPVEIWPHEAALLVEVARDAGVALRIRQTKRVVVRSSAAACHFVFSRLRD